MAFPTTGLLDNFNRADGNLGANWTNNISPGSGGGGVIVSNQWATGVADGNFYENWWDAATFGPDVECYCTLSVKPTDNEYFYMHIRIVNPNSANLDSYSFVLPAIAGTDLLYIGRVDDSVETQLGASISQEISNTDVLGLEAIGSAITAYRNGVALTSRTDSTYIQSGNIGIGGSAAALRVDDFSGGTVSISTSPVIAATATTDGTTASTTPVVDLPSGIVEGNLLLVLFRTAIDTLGITWPSGWTNTLFNNTTDESNDQISMAWRKADGTEGSTITLATSNAKFAAIAMRITGAADPTAQVPDISTIATGSSTTPDPTIVTPTGGAKDYLWIWAGGWEGEQTSPPASTPTNYTNPIGANSGTAGVVTTNVRVAIASRNSNAISESPGSWTISVTDDWTAYTIAVHPIFSANLVWGKTIMRQAVNRSSLY